MAQQPDRHAPEIVLERRILVEAELGLDHGLLLAADPSIVVDGLQDDPTRLLRLLGRVGRLRTIGLLGRVAVAVLRLCRFGLRGGRSTR